MSNKMKGLLKGLRYISQIFEEEEEQEMQIGFPTDVKHVAHIGWDGPASNAPSWIQKFKDGDSGASQNGDQQNAPRSRDPRLPAQEKRNSTGSESSILESPSRRRSDKSKGARRHSSAGSSAADSPKRTSTSSESRTKLPPGPDSPSRDPTSSSKTSRRRKTKGSSKSKSTSTTPELSYSDPGIGAPRSGGGSLLKGKDNTCQSSVLTGSENDQNALDDQARRIHAITSLESDQLLQQDI